MSRIAAAEFDATSCVRRGRKVPWRLRGNQRAVGAGCWVLGAGVWGESGGQGGVGGGVKLCLGLRGGNVGRGVGHVQFPSH